MKKGRDRIKQILYGMNRRCNNPKRKEYANYGGRGIKVCAEWSNDVESFVQWSLENGYTDEMTIDRIDNERGYSPDNCRWVTMKTQSRNHRNNRFVEINGEVKTCAEWAAISGVSPSTILYRLKSGLTSNELIKPSRSHLTPLMINGVTKTYSEWGVISSLNPRTIRDRVKRGWNESDLLNPLMGTGRVYHG